MLRDSSFIIFFKLCPLKVFKISNFETFVGYKKWGLMKEALNYNFREDHNMLFLKKISIWNSWYQSYSIKKVVNCLIVESFKTRIDQDENFLLDKENILFQHDGAPPHFVIFIQNWFNDRFPEKQFKRKGAKNGQQDA